MHALVEPVELLDAERSVHRTVEVRERLILEHLPQARMLARRIHDRLPENVSLDDLVSTGVLGLISAIDHFDPSRGVQLRTYAEHKIRGAILDSLRRLDWAPRQDRRRTQPYRRWLSPLAGKYSRAQSGEAGVGGKRRFR